MKRLLLFALAIASFSALTACSSDSDDGGGSPIVRGPGSPTGLRDSGAPDGESRSEAPADFVLKCSAQVTGPYLIDYTVSGNTLHFSAGGQSIDMTLVSAGTGKPVYGTWQLPTVLLDGSPAFIEKHQLKVISTMRIEADRITISADCSSKYHAMSVTASSPATVTDSTVEILESHHEEKRWTPRDGEKTTSTAAIDPSTLHVLAQEPGTVMLRAALPFH